MERFSKHFLSRGRKNSAGTDYKILVANSNCVGTTARIFASKPHKLDSFLEQTKNSLAATSELQKIF